MIAAKDGDLVSVLEFKESQLYMQDSKGKTALMYAASRNQVEAAQLLLEEMHQRTLENETALMIAARAQALACVHLLLPEAGATNNNGEMAFQLALRTHNLKLIRVLCEAEVRGAEVCEDLC